MTKQFIKISTSDAKATTKKINKAIQKFLENELLVGIPKETVKDEKPEEVKPIKQKGALVAVPASLFPAKEEKKKETQYVADIAVANEFGTFSKKGNKHIPSRPFLTTTIARYNKQITKFFENEVRSTFEGKASPKKALERVGVVVAGYVRKNLTDGDWEANSPITIALKNGKATPLINTGQLRQSVTSIVRKQGEKDE